MCECEQSMVECDMCGKCDWCCDCVFSRIPQEWKDKVRSGRYERGYPPRLLRPAP
jgi:hypothetical protein